LFPGDHHSLPHGYHGEKGGIQDEGGESLEEILGWLGIHQIETIGVAEPG